MSESQRSTGDKTEMNRNDQIHLAVYKEYVARTEGTLNRFYTDLKFYIGLISAVLAGVAVLIKD
jgi:hypothetical protein